MRVSHAHGWMDAVAEELQPEIASSDKVLALLPLQPVLLLGYKSHTETNKANSHTETNKANSHKLRALSTINVFSNCTLKLYFQTGGSVAEWLELATRSRSLQAGSDCTGLDCKSSNPLHTTEFR